MSNLTDKQFQEIFNALPDDLDEDHLAALIMTLVDTYSPSGPEGVVFLLAVVYSFARAKGCSREAFARLASRLASEFAEGFVKQKSEYKH